MLENFADMVRYSWEKVQHASEHKDSMVGEYSCQMLSVEHIRDVCRIYENYKGCKEFLYVPSTEEIEKNVMSSESCYVGLFDGEQNLMGVAKLERLRFPYPFFALPKDEQAGEGDCYGLSGLLVASEHRNKGVAKKLVNASLGALSFYGAKGIYADCEYRNQASFATLSHTLDFVGFVDGRNGAEGEQSIYLTFYKNCEEKYQKNNEGIALNFANTKTLDDVAEVLQTQLRSMGEYTRLTTPYQKGTNELYLLNTPVLTPKMKLLLEPERKRKFKIIQPVEQNVSALVGEGIER